MQRSCNRHVTVVRQARLYFFFSSLTFTFLPYLTYCLILFFAAQLVHTPLHCVSHSSCPSPPTAVEAAFSPSVVGCEIDGPKLVSFVFYMQARPPA